MMLEELNELNKLNKLLPSVREPRAHHFNDGQGHASFEKPRRRDCGKTPIPW
jgi:hypothetical protein